MILKTENTVNIIFTDCILALISCSGNTGPSEDVPFSSKLQCSSLPGPNTQPLDDYETIPYKGTTMIQKNDNKLRQMEPIHIATVAKSTVISSGLPPTASIPL